MSTVKLKRSSVAGKIPTTAQLDLGELAINTTDGKIYFKKRDDVANTEVIVDATIYQTPSDLLTAIKTVDGANSGLDADLWDGNQFADYLDQSVRTTDDVSFANTSITSSLIMNSPDGNNAITVRMLDSDTLTFNGNSGQLFSISDDLTGTIFSVNDISGIPLIEVDADATIALAPIDGNVGIGTNAPSSKLEVVAASSLDTALGVTIRNTDSTSDPQFELGVGYPGYYDNSAIIKHNNILTSWINTSGQMNFMTTVQIAANKAIQSLSSGNSQINLYDINNNTAVGYANNLVFNYAGTEIARFTNAGSLGIGISSPENKLHVNSGAITVDGTSTVSVRDGFNSYGIKLTGNDTGIFYQYGGGIRMFFEGPTNARAMAFHTRGDNHPGGTEKVRISGAGDVGIGTTAPSSKLDVAGVITGDGFTSSAVVTVQDTATRYLELDHGGARSYFTSRYDSANGGFIFRGYNGTAYTNRFQIDINGDLLGYDTTGADVKLIWDVSTERFGIGTSTPETTLHLGASGSRLRITSSTTGRWTDLYSDNDANIAQSSGGVNLITPIQKLHIGGTENSYVTLGGYDFVVNANTSTEVARFTAAGSLGIGTSNPGAYRLAVKGDQFTNAVIESTQVGSYLQLKASSGTVFLSTPTADAMGFHTGSSAIERMRILSDGKVTVGTTTAVNSGTLSVKGDSRQAITAIVTDDQNSLFQGFNSAAGLAFQVTGTGRGHVSTSMSIGTTASFAPMTIAESQGAGIRMYDSDNSVGYVQVNTNVNGDFIVDVDPAVSGTFESSFRVNVDNVDDILRVFDDRVVFKPSGTEAMRITNAGNVGIGTSAPKAILDISKSGEVAPRITSSDGLGDAVLRFYSGSTFKGQIGWDQAADVVGIYPTTTSATPTISVDGLRVGIGTTSPVSDLSVVRNHAGDTAIEVSNLGTPGITTTASFILSETPGIPLGWFRRYRDGSARTDIGFQTNLTFSSNSNTTPVERMRIDVNGNVGIGTTTPSAKLHVKSSGTGTEIFRAECDLGATTGRFIRIIAPSIDNGSAPFTINTNNSLAIGDDSDINVTITEAGNVGIGSTNPQYKFVVSEGSNGNGYEVNPLASSVQHIHYDRTDANYSVAGYYASDFIWYAGSSPTEQMRLSNNGNLGIGTSTPYADLHVVGSATNSEVRIGASSNHTSRLSLVERLDGNGAMDYGFSITTDGANTNNLLIRNHENDITGNVSISVSRAEGYVGINTSAPALPLDVDGTVRATQFRLANTGVYDDSGATTTSTTQGVIFQYSASAYGGGKFLIEAKAGVERHITELLITHNGTTAVATEYGTIYTNASLATYDVDISGGNVRILVNPASGATTTYKVLTQTMFS